MRRTVIRGAALTLAITLLAAVWPHAQSLIGNFTSLKLGGLAGAGTVDVTTGTGTPEGVVTGTVGDLFVRTDGGIGTSVYTKQSGTGNTGWSGLGVVEKLWFPAAICNNATPASHGWSFPTTNPGVPACQTGTNTQYGTMDFADAANLSAQLHLKLPSDFTGTLDAKFVWFTSATSGNVVWQLATICVADAETSDPAFNTASTVTDAAKGTTLQLNDASITTVTITGCAAGELMFLKVQRDSAHASDTVAATARLVGLELTYRRAL